MTTERHSTGKRPYQEPSVTLLGSVTELTRGTGQNPLTDAVVTSV